MPSQKFIFYMILVIAAGAALAFLVEILRVLRQKNLKQEESIEDRIGRLTDSLHEAVALISNIEAEIKGRSNLVLQLQKDVEQYDKLVKLKLPEVEAIAQVFRGELIKEGRQTFWKGVLISFVFFLLGAAASWFINLWTK